MESVGSQARPPRGLPTQLSQKLSLVRYMNYEVTLTLRPSFFRQRHPRDQHQIAKEYLSQVMLRDSVRREKISLIAELTGEVNVHYHGIIFLKDHCHRAQFLNRFRRKDIDRVFGRKTCSQLRNYPVWCEYMNKSTRDTRDIIGDPIVFDDFNVYSDPQYRFMVE